MKGNVKRVIDRVKEGKILKKVIIDVGKGLRKRRTEGMKDWINKSQKKIPCRFVKTSNLFFYVHHF